MKEHTNFYENLKEAQMRLRGTVVLYDGIPCYVLAITNHKADGIFRIYLDPIGWDPTVSRPRPCPENYGPEDPGAGIHCDTWMEKNPNSPVMRKMMNSKLFNKFRPYPLGMCNVGTSTYYIERQPNRKSEQGLIRTMLQQTMISTAQNGGALARVSSTVDVHSEAFRACVMADHPSAQTTLEQLSDPTIGNEAVAFHREFALVRGPVEMLFLAYKEDVIGVLPKNDFSLIRLGRTFGHTREVVAGLNLFADIR
jgi:hypothetical protein